MQVNVREITADQFVLVLGNLKKILQKAEAYAAHKKIDPQVLLQTRLFPDMFPLAKQIQTACDAAKFGAARLTAVPAPAFEDKEVAFAEFYERIDKTIAFVRTLENEDFQAFESQIIKFPWNPGKKLSGHDYLVQFALPNFYFHVTTAYNILRSSGVEIGKADYLGPIHWQDDV